MSKLDDAIRHAVERGEFVHLSVVSTDNGRSFAATFASASRAAGYARGESSDPAEAMAQAIMSAPMARKSPGIHHPSTWGIPQQKPSIASDDEALG